MSSQLDLDDVLAGCGVDVMDRLGGEIKSVVKEGDFRCLMQSLSDSGFNLANLFCAEDFQSLKGFTLFYTFEKKAHHEVLTVKRTLGSSEASSIEDLYPTACWYEREIRDGFGIVFTGAYDARRLFLHECYPDDFHPLKKSFKNRTLEGIQRSSTPYSFKEVSGEDVYQIPVGPVHAGIIEPGHFRFSVIGENIYNLEVRMFYKHRGIEKLVEGKSPKDALRYAQAISGDESVANAVCFCKAVEDISKASAPERAWHLRTCFMELERIYSHLGDMAGMVVDVAYPSGASPFFILREELLRHNMELTGSRFMRDIVSVGGLSRDVGDDALQSLTDYLADFIERFSRATDDIWDSASVMDRFEGTGVVKHELVNPLNLSGPTARASNTRVDTRKDHPYGIYERFLTHVRVESTCDVLARFNVKALEIKDSASLIMRLMKKMPLGDIFSVVDVADGYRSSLVEAPRGQNIHWMNVKDGVLDRYKVRTASFCNWQAIEHAVIGNIVPDFPLINKSLNLSYAGTDL